MEPLTLKPPQIVDTGDRPIIFLAGPIQGGPDWQEQATAIVHALNPYIVVANPRRDYYEDSVPFIYEQQVDWETHYLRAAGQNGAVLFWLAHHVSVDPERPYGQTTRFEIGEWKTRAQLLGEKVVVGFDEGFSNSRYIRRRFTQDCPQVPLCDSLQETCEAAVRLCGLLAKR